MNILSINTVDTRGGAAKMAYTLKIHLARQGHKTSMFVKHKYSNDPSVFIAQWPNPVNRLMKILTGKDLGSVLANKIRPWLSNDIEYFKSDEILKTKEFREADVVHCHNLHGNYFKLDTLRKMSEIKPVIWTLHDTWAITSHCARIYDEKIENGFYKCDSLKEYQDLVWNNEKYLKEKKKRIYARLKNIYLTTPSKWLLDKTKQSVLGDKQIKLVYDGVDTSIFRPQNKKTVRQKLGLSADKKIILTASAIGQDKGKGSDFVENIIQKFSFDENTLFILAGYNSRSISQKYKNAICIDYIRSEEAMSNYLAAADILLYPSLAESFGLIVAEAMSCGTPSVIFPVGGLPEIIEHKKNGYIAELKNCEDLERGINFLLNLNDEEKNTMATVSVEKAKQQFSLEKMVYNYLNLYHSVVK